MSIEEEEIGSIQENIDSKSNWKNWICNIKDYCKIRRIPLKLIVHILLALLVITQVRISNF